MSELHGWRLWRSGALRLSRRRTAALPRVRRSSRAIPNCRRPLRKFGISPPGCGEKPNRSSPRPSRESGRPNKPDCGPKERPRPSRESGRRNANGRPKEPAGRPKERPNKPDCGPKQRHRKGSPRLPVDQLKRSRTGALGAPNDILEETGQILSKDWGLPASKIHVNNSRRAGAGGGNADKEGDSGI